MFKAIGRDPGCKVVSKPMGRLLCAIACVMCLQTAAGSPQAPVSPPATTARPEGASDDCALITAAGEPIATVALGDRVDPSNAPRPTNEAERLLFRQLYETLVRIDCNGRVVPGLATSWRLDADGRTWLVTLRDTGRFSDGTLLTANGVRASWTRSGVGDELRPEVSRLLETATAVDDRSLAVTLRHQQMDAPAALAHSDLAIAKPGADSPWPDGTRSARIVRDNDSPKPRVSAMTISRDNLPAIRFLIAPGDPRDLLDEGVDVLLTRDPAALDYAATLPQFQSVPLAWQRTYVLIVPGRSRSAPSLTEEARQILATDAIRGEARGARGPFWWQAGPDCNVAFAAARESPAYVPRIVYDANDNAARDLAERFVGLVRASGPAATVFLDALLPDRPRRSYQRATGLTGEGLAQARRRGTDAGYVMAIDRQPVDRCHDLQGLMDGARWLDPQTIVPLVETRLRAVIRRGRSGLTVEGDGGLVIAGAPDSR